MKMIDRDNKELFCELKIKNKVRNEIKINNILAVIKADDFIGSVNLIPGFNNISVKASTKAGNSCEKDLVVNYYLDLTGPKITIIEPAVTRGIKIVSKKYLVKKNDLLKCLL